MGQNSTVSYLEGKPPWRDSNLRPLACGNNLPKCVIMTGDAFSSTILINNLDVGNPLHIHPNNNSSTNLIPFKLLGAENYRIWVSVMKLALETRNKFAFLDGTCVKSAFQTMAGDGVAGIKRCRRDLSSDGVRNLATASGRGRLKEDLESNKCGTLRSTPSVGAKRVYLISFCGNCRSEDPNQHLKDFLKLVDSLDLDRENRERTRICLFQFALRDQASNWLKHLPAGSITTWEDLTTRFLAQSFTPGEP
ncbi:zinc finger, CCHC-type containing protein [Tanacetum coccineum]